MTYDDDDDYDRPQRRRERPAKKSSNKVLWIILAVVVAPIVLCFVGCMGFGVWATVRKASLTDAWTDHTISDDADRPVATASFPGQPLPDIITIATPQGDGPIEYYRHDEQQDSILEATVAIGFIDLPAGTKNPLDTAYRAIRDQMAEQYMDNVFGLTMRPKSESSTVVDGFPAKESIYNDDNGNFIIRVVHINNRPANSKVRLVVMIAGGQQMAMADRDKFLQSVRIEKPAKR
jgi:nitrate reductase NapE component